MNILSSLIIFFAFLIVGIALLPILSVGLVLLLMTGGFLIWLLPILIIACSDKTSGGEKFCWILAIIFLSWFAWIFYFFLAPLKPKPRYSYYYDHV